MTILDSYKSTMHFIWDSALSRCELEADQKILSAEGCKPTGEMLVKCIHTGMEFLTIRLVVCTGDHTPLGYIRDCGDCYIENTGAGYRRISRDLKSWEDGVEDCSRLENELRSWEQRMRRPIR